MKKLILFLFVALLATTASYAQYEFSCTIHGQGLWIDPESGDTMSVPKPIIFQFPTEQGTAQENVLPDSNGYFSFTLIFNQYDISFPLEITAIYHDSICNYHWQESVTIENIEDTSDKYLEPFLYSCNVEEEFAFVWYPDDQDYHIIHFEFIKDLPITQITDMRIEYGDGVYDDLSVETDTISHRYEQNGEYTARLLGFIHYPNNGLDTIIFETPVYVYPSEEPPVGCFADFIYYIDTITPDGNYIVQFLNFSDAANGLNNAQFEWIFGDGSSSTEEEPMHIYTQPGEYWVTLFMDNNGCTDSITLPVWVDQYDSLWMGNDYENCEALFAPMPYYNDTLNDGYPVEFIDLSWPGVDGNINTYFWDFGDGHYSNLSNPIHVYQDTGTYTVYLAIQTDYGCASSFAMDIQVTDFDDTTWVLFYPNIDTSQKGIKVKFHDLSGRGVEGIWDFGDAKGQTKGSGVVYHTYANPGQYTVTLTDPNTNKIFGMDIQVSSDNIEILRSFTKEGSSSPSITKNMITEQLKVYPNPVIDMINIKLPNKTNAYIEIYTTNGQLIKSSAQNTNIIRINVSDIPKGVYTIRIKTAKDTYSTKFIK